MNYTVGNSLELDSNKHLLFSAALDGTQEHFTKCYRTDSIGQPWLISMNARWQESPESQGADQPLSKNRKQRHSHLRKPEVTAQLLQAISPTLKRARRLWAGSSINCFLRDQPEPGEDRLDRYTGHRKLTMLGNRRFAQGDPGIRTYWENPQPPFFLGGGGINKLGGHDLSNSDEVPRKLRGPRGQQPRAAALLSEKEWETHTRLQRIGKVRGAITDRTKICQAQTLEYT